MSGWKIGSLGGMCLVLAWSCQPAIKQFMQYGGQTMGTYYRITCEHAPDLSEQMIEETLAKLNQALSTYDSSSLISHFNRSAQGLDLAAVDDDALSTYFMDNVQLSLEIGERSHGYFDPTVMPLVNFWGFGYVDQRQEGPIDSQEVQRLLTHVGLDKIAVDGKHIQKSLPQVELDFSAVAKGYAIDQLGHLLEDLGIENYLIDIGGETRARGTNAEGRRWRIGIADPAENALFDSFRYILELRDQSVATSGNYRNFYEANDMIISHTMNPKTGFFERNRLLSVSIVSADCAVSDAYATACMAMGLEQCQQLLAQRSELEGFLIFADEQGQTDTFVTPGLQDAVTPATN